MNDILKQMLSRKNLCWRDGAPGLKPSLFQIRYGDISLRYYDNPERSCAGVYKIETHAWAPRIPWHLTSGEKEMNLNYKECRREAPTRSIMESKHTEAATPEGRRAFCPPLAFFLKIFMNCARNTSRMYSKVKKYARKIVVALLWR